MRLVFGLVVAGVAVLTVACSQPPPDPTSAALPFAAAAPALQPATEAPSDALPGATSHPAPDRMATAPTRPEPDLVAADVVIALLEDEDLLTLDLNSTLTVDAEGSAIVAVRVLFGTGRSHPHEETYLVRLVEDAGGWAVTDLEVAP